MRNQARSLHGGGILLYLSRSFRPFPFIWPCFSVTLLVAFLMCSKGRCWDLDWSVMVSGFGIIAGEKKRGNIVYAAATEFWALFSFHFSVFLLPTLFYMRTGFPASPFVRSAVGRRLLPLEGKRLMTGRCVGVPRGHVHVAFAAALSYRKVIADDTFQCWRDAGAGVQGVATFDGFRVELPDAEMGM